MNTLIKDLDFSKGNYYLIHQMSPILMHYRIYDISDFNTPHKFSISKKEQISGLGMVRKWHLVLVKDEAILFYNKREIKKSKDLSDIKATLDENAKRLENQFIQKGVNKAKKNEDLRFILIDKIRKRAIGNSYDTRVYNDGHSILIDCVIEKQAFPIIDIRLSESGEASVFIVPDTDLKNKTLQIADPSFDPDIFIDNIFSAVKETQNIIREFISKLDKICLNNFK